MGQPERPGYLNFYSESSVAGSMASAVDAETAAQGGSLAPDPITIPMETITEQLDRFAGLAGEGHAGADKLYSAYTVSELADHDAQLNYDLFVDAAAPAEQAAFRFAKLDDRATTDLSDDALTIMTGKTATGKRTGTSTLQETSVPEGAPVSLAAERVSVARKGLRVAHTGIKDNLLAAKLDLLEKKRDAKQEEVADYERKVAKIGQVLNTVSLLFTLTSSAASLATFLGSRDALDGVAAVGDAGGSGTAAVGVGAGLGALERISELKQELATQTKFIGELEAMREDLAIQSNLDKFSLAISEYELAQKELDAAISVRRQHYAQAGQKTDDQLAGTADKGKAGQAMLRGSAMLEASTLLDTALEELWPAVDAVAAARDAVEPRKSTWYYRDSYMGVVLEHPTPNFAADSDVPALNLMAAVLEKWKDQALAAKDYLLIERILFEGEVLVPAGAGATPEGDTY